MNGGGSHSFRAAQDKNPGLHGAQGFSVVGKKKKESPQSGKMGLSKTQLPKEVTNEAYHTRGDEYRGGCV